MVLKKAAFDALMRSHGLICLQVYRNVVQIMGERLRQSRVLRRGGQEELQSPKGQLRRIEAEINHMQRARVAS